MERWTKLAESANHGFIEIISVITVAIGAILGGVFTMLNTKYKFTLDSKKASKMTMMDKIKVNLAMKKNIREIRIQLEADRVSLCLYHNGDSFISGLKIDRFSMVQEDYAPNVESMTLQMQNIAVSAFPVSTYSLLFDKAIYTEDLDCNETKIGKAMIEIMKKAGVASFYMFLLEDEKETPLGFLTVAYNKKTPMDRNDALYVQSFLHKFVRLITLKYTIDDIE